MSKIIDVSQTYSQVDFYQHIPDDHLFKQLSLQVAAMCKMPINSVLLAGLTVFSSMACRKWCVNYEHVGRLPIGLYTIIEQPSGTAKSRVVEFFQKPFFEHQKTVISRLKIANDRALKELKEAQGDDKKECKEEFLMANEAYLNARIPLFTTNSTPEAMEKLLIKTLGYFAAISSEQSLINTLIGGMYVKSGTPKNNEILLAGNTGGYFSGGRVTREAYVGRAIGGVLAFAQTGSIETILSESKGTGLAERFIFLREQHLLGTRDHLKWSLVDRGLLERYENMCSFICSIIESPVDCENLMCLEISPAGFKEMGNYRNRLEKTLADGGKFSSSSMRGMVSKADMLIMKMAALLHITSGLDIFSPIDDDYIKSAIGITGELIESSYEAAVNNGHIGEKSEFESILSLFEKDQRPRSERNIITSKDKTLPFKNYAGNKSAAIRSTLAKMVAEGVLKANGNPVKLYALA